MATQIRRVGVLVEIILPEIWPLDEATHTQAEAARLVADPYFETQKMKLEYQFGRTAQSGMALAYEPSFDKLVCGLGERGFSTSKKQVGLDFFRIWRR